jgi:hypothetical protein
VAESNPLPPGRFLSASASPLKFVVTHLEDGYNDGLWVALDLRDTTRLAAARGEDR